MISNYSVCVFQEFKNVSGSVIPVWLEVGWGDWEELSCIIHFLSCPGFFLSFSLYSFWDQNVLWRNISPVLSCQNSFVAVAEIQSTGWNQREILVDFHKKQSAHRFQVWLGSRSLSSIIRMLVLYPPGDLAGLESPSMAFGEQGNESWTKEFVSVVYLCAISDLLSSTWWWGIGPFFQIQ